MKLGRFGAGQRDTSGSDHPGFAAGGMTMEPTRAAPESSDERELAAAVEAVPWRAIPRPGRFGPGAQVPLSSWSRWVEGMRSQRKCFSGGA